MFKFILPDLGEGVHEGEVLKWHVESGAHIEEDEPLVDIETDKAAITIPSPRSGTVVTCNGNVGDIVLVGDVIVVIDDGTGSADSEVMAIAATADTTKAQSADATVSSQNPNGQSSVPAKANRPGNRVIAAPATRRLARELNVNIQEVPPTGPAGRVTPEDVNNFATHGADTAQSVQPAADPEQFDHGSPTGTHAIPLLDIESLPDFSKWGEVEVEPLRSIRRKVARKMVTSMIMVPHVAHMDEADVTLLDEIRRKENQKRADQSGGKVTLLAFVIRAVTEGLKTWPMFNASLDAVKEQIIYKHFYNIGVAVDSGRGLIVPVIRDTDRKSVLQLSTEIAESAAKARTNELAVDELQGGSFTITNIGSLGGTGMIPTINYPEVAILGMGRVQDKPVVVDGEIAIRKMMPLTLAFDHRIADGADAARFMTQIVNRLSDPHALLIET